MEEIGLIGDMQALLNALERGGESQNETWTESEVAAAPAVGSGEPASLEFKLGQLLSALQANDSDEWEGKPPQEDLGIRFDFSSVTGRENLLTAATEGQMTESQLSLDKLMEEYVEAVRDVRAVDEMSDRQA
ncbi:hypothetical protein ERJ75_000239600 [Trypanosoma vivax]|nr:hypothetical protein ERJ75_000239600 [Trypanosoma vivax]